MGGIGGGACGNAVNSLALLEHSMQLEKRSGGTLEALP